MSERRLLYGVAETGDAALLSTEFLWKYQLGAASSVRRMVERLTRKSIIDRSKTGFRIIDPVFAHWIKRVDLPGFKQS